MKGHRRAKKPGSPLMRSEIADGVCVMATSDPETLRARICTEDWETAWLSAFKVRLIHGERDAVRLYAEARKLVGSEKDVHVLILQQLGAPSAEYAREAIQQRKESERVDVDHAKARAVELLRMLIGHDPEARSEVHEMLFGTRACTTVPILNGKGH